MNDYPIIADSVRIFELPAFTEKVATMKEYQFDGGSGGAKWRETIKMYLISKAPEIEIILKSVEAHEDVQATTADLRSRNLGLVEDRMRSLARDLGLLDIEPGGRGQSVPEQLHTGRGL